MKSPEITWYIENNDEPENITKEYYVGSYNPNSYEVIMNLQIWNNRYGQEDAQDIENPSLAITFSNLEDCKLLEYTKVKIDNNAYESPNIINNTGKIIINRILSGEANVGESKNSNNCIHVSIKVEINNNMKNGLKNLLIDLQY